MVESHTMTISSKDRWEPLNWPFPSFYASLHSTWVKPGPQLLLAWECRELLPHSPVILWSTQWTLLSHSHGVGVHVRCVFYPVTTTTFQFWLHILPHGWSHGALGAHFKFPDLNGGVNAVEPHYSEVVVAGNNFRYSCGSPFCFSVTMINFSWHSWLILG